MNSVHFQGKPFSITVIQVYTSTTNTEEAGVNGSMMPTRPSRTNTKTKKRCRFHLRWLKCKRTKSRDIWSNRQVWPWSTKWSTAKTNCFAKRTHLSSQTPSSNTQGKTTHGHHQVVNTYIRSIIFFAVKDGEALYSQQKQDRELTVAQIMNSVLPNSDLNWRK